MLMDMETVKVGIGIGRGYTSTAELRLAGIEFRIRTSVS